MWYLYGIVSLVLSMVMLLGLKFADKDYESWEYLILIVLSLICVFAGLDWLNLIPEV